MLKIYFKIIKLLKQILVEIYNYLTHSAKVSVKYATHYHFNCGGDTTDTIFFLSFFLNFIRRTGFNICGAGHIFFIDAVVM